MARTDHGPASLVVNSTRGLDRGGLSMRTLQGSSGHHEQSQWAQNKHLEDLRQSLAWLWTESHECAMPWGLYVSSLRRYTKQSRAISLVSRTRTFK